MVDTMGVALPHLIQKMLQTEFYSHGVQQPVQLIQTHISYVLLTGEFAYKIKKAVSFGFLDFTTLEKRQHFCQEELRLNRRLSPELYLAVIPIVFDGVRYHFAEAADLTDAVVEYAVQMRQFPQSGLFSHLFQSGELTPELVQQLARAVADFHAIAITNDEIQAYGSPDAVRQVEHNNLQISIPFIGRSQTQKQYDETQTFTHQFCQEHAQWLTQRQLDCKIRECHGDLHLNNVCLYQNKIQIFDCIEFNQDFRNIDVIYDAAFMVMDLTFQGRFDLANLFLNTYLEQAGDYWSAALLPLYLTMRAYIRGNVNALALDDPDIGESEKQSCLERSRAYYGLAWRYTQRASGQIILMSGLSGSGKSTVARQIAQQINAIHIRSDAVRKRLAGISLQSREDDSSMNGGLYTPEMTQLTYGRILELGIFLAQQGWSVILDAKYDRRSLRQAVLEIAKTTQLPIQIVQCTAPPAVLRERLRHRSGDISDATDELLDSQIQAEEQLTGQEQTFTTVIHTEQDLASQIATIVSRPKKA